LFFLIFSFPIGVDLQKVNPLFSSYIDLEADIGRVTLSLAGPRDDAAYPSYELIVGTNRVMKTEDRPISIQIKGDKNQSKRIPLIDNDERLKAETTSKFFLYGVCYLGEVYRRIELIHFFLILFTF
jgi:hypothetical protein